MNNTLFCFVDDIRFDQLSKGDIPAETALGYASYTLTATALQDLLDTVTAKKADLGLCPFDPVKRSMDDQIRRHYRDSPCPKPDEHFLIAKKNVANIGRFALRRLAKLDARIIACVNWPYSDTPARPDLLQWAFENLLQRVGLVLVKHQSGCTFPSLTVIVDRGNERDLLPAFAIGYWKGETVQGQPYHSGALKDLAMFGTLLFSATPYSIGLQVADFVSGACRDFVKWAHDGKYLKKAWNWFGLIIGCLDRGNDGKVDGFGFKINPAPGFSVDQKIQELKRAIQMVRHSGKGE